MTGARVGNNVSTRAGSTYVVCLLAAVTFFYQLDRNVMYVTQELIKREYGLTDTQLGLLTGIAYGLANAVAGDNVVVIDATKCVVKAPNDKLLLLQGLDDFIVVDTKDVLLICKREKEQEIKEYVAELKRSKGDHYL